MKETLRTESNDKNMANIYMEITQNLCLCILHLIFCLFFDRIHDFIMGLIYSVLLTVSDQ